MIQRDIYLMNAAFLLAMAEAEKVVTISAGLEDIAWAYLRLAQTQGYSQNDVVNDALPQSKERDRP
jgi:hypothetical protein